MATWLEEALERERGRQQRAAAASASDAGYFGGFISSAVSGVGEMFGMEPFPTADRFRQDHPISGLASEIAGAIVPYVGWEGVLAKAPRIATALGGAAGRLGIEASTMPIRAGAVNLAVRYSPVELSRLGVGLFTTDDWDKYQGLMADVGLSTMLAGGIGGLGGWLKSGGTVTKQAFGKVAEAPQGLAAPFELRMSRASPNVSYIGGTKEEVENRLLREALTERPLHNRAVNALVDNNEPKAIKGLNMLFNPHSSGRGITRQKLMNDDGTWALGDEGNAKLLGALGKNSIEEIAEAGRFPTKVTVGSSRAAGTMRDYLEGLSPVDGGAWIGQEAGDGLFVTVIRTELGKTSQRAATKRAEVQTRLNEIDSILGTKAARGMTPSLKAEKKQLYSVLAKLGPEERVNAGDEFFAIKTDKPDLFIKKIPQTAKVTVSEFAKYRSAYRPDVNQDTIFNKAQNDIIATFLPEDLMNIARGSKETARAAWLNRATSKAAGGLGMKDSEALRNVFDELYQAIAPSMAKGVRNSMYDRLFMFLGVNKTVADMMLNRMVGGAVKLTPRRFGLPRGEHLPEVEQGTGIRTLNKLFGDNADKLTADDFRLFNQVSETQTPKELIAELTANGQVSPAAKNVLDGLEQLDKWFWSKMMPVAESLGIDGKFKLLEGTYIPKMLKGDNFVQVVDKNGKTVYIASGTRRQAQEMADAMVLEAKEKGLEYTARPPKSWYHEHDELLEMNKAMGEALGKDATVAEIARLAARRVTIANSAGMRQGMLRAGMPKSLTTERKGLMSQSGTGELTAKQMIKDLQQHYGMISRYFAHESWKQRWAVDYTRLGGRSELARLNRSDEAMARDIVKRAGQMMGYASPQAKYLDSVLRPVFGTAMGGKAASKIAQEANSLMYHWNIGIFNPVFALVNLLTPVQTVAPWIALMKTAPQAADDLMHTTFRFGADGKPKGIFNTLDVPKLMGKSLRELGNPDEDLLEAMGRAKTEGALAPQMFENFAGHGSAAQVGIRDAYHLGGGGISGSWEAMKKIATWASTHSEEFSREYAFAAGWVVGRDLKGLTGEALYQFARRAVHVTQYGYHTMDRSMLFTGPIGSMFGLFKNWQMHFISSMFQYAGLGWREGIWAPLIWQFAGSLAVGGIGATPLVLVADQITDWMDKQPNSYLWMKENFHGAADEIYYGFPALFGLSLQASASLPGTDVRNDLTMLSNFVFLERAKAAFKATKGAWDYAEQNGQNPLENPNVRDALLQGFAPRALWRLFSATENDAIKSMSSGYPQVRNVSLGGQVAYSLGMNPVEIEEQQDAARYLWRDQEAQRKAIAAHGQRLANAELNGDADEIMATIKHGMALGLPMTSVAKSAQTRLRREQQQDLLTKYGYPGMQTRMALEDD